jgi:hypothetical protein
MQLTLVSQPQILINTEVIALLSKEQRLLSDWLLYLMMVLVVGSLMRMA